MYYLEFMDWAGAAKCVELFMQVFPTSSDCFMWENGSDDYDDDIIFEAYKEYINEVVNDFNLRRTLCRIFGEEGEVEYFLKECYESYETDIKAKYEELENEGFVCQGTEPLPKLLVEQNDIRTQLEQK